MICWHFSRYKVNGTWLWAVHRMRISDGLRASCRVADGFASLALAREWARGRARFERIAYREAPREKKAPSTPHDEHLAKVREEVMLVHFTDRVATEAIGRGEFLRAAEALISSVQRVKKLIELQPGELQHNINAALNRIDEAIEALQAERARFLAQATKRPRHLRLVASPERGATEP